MHKVNGVKFEWGRGGGTGGYSKTYPLTQWAAVIACGGFKMAALQMWYPSCSSDSWNGKSSISTDSPPTIFRLFTSLKCRAGNKVMVAIKIQMTPNWALSSFIFLSLFVHKSNHLKKKKIKILHCIAFRNSCFSFFTLTKGEIQSITLLFEKLIYS